MFINLGSIATRGTNQSTPMVSYVGQKTISDTYTLSKRNPNQLPAAGTVHRVKKFFIDKEERKNATKDFIVE